MANENTDGTQASTETTGDQTTEKFLQVTEAQLAEMVNRAVTAQVKRLKLGQQTQVTEEKQARPSVEEAEEKQTAKARLDRLEAELKAEREAKRNAARENTLRQSLQAAGAANIDWSCPDSVDGLITLLAV